MRTTLALVVLVACSTPPAKPPPATPPSTPAPIASPTASPTPASPAPSSDDACQTCADAHMTVSAPDYSVSAETNLERGSAAFDQHDVPLGMKYLAFVKARYPSEASRVAAILDAHRADIDAFHDQCLASCQTCASVCDVARWCPAYCAD